MTHKRQIHLSSYIKFLGLAACIIIVYYAGTWLGKLMILETGLASPIWPPTGIAIASVLRWGHRTAPAIFIGALLASDWQGSTYWAATANSLFSTLEAMACVWLIQSYTPNSYPFEKASNVLVYCCVTLLVLLFSTTLEVGINLYRGSIQPENFNTTWITWYLGDYTGAVLIAPFFLTLLRTTPFRQLSGKITEISVLFLLVIAASLLIFGGWLPDTRDDYGGVFLLIPLLIWVAYRFRVLGTTTAVALISIIAIWGTIQGHGPFVKHSAIEFHLILQTFALVIALTLMIFSAVLIERDTIQLRLQEREKRYRDFVSNSTEGIWRAILRKPLPTQLPLEQQIDWIFEHAYFAEANDIQARKFGLTSSDQLVGLQFREIVSDAEPKNREAIRSFIESGYKARDLLTTGLGREGEVRYFSAHVSGHIDRDTLVYIWGIVADITERKRLEEVKEKSRQQELQLIQANKMGSLGILIAGVAHEINNPNKVVLLNAQTLTKVWKDSEIILDTHYRDDPDDLLGGLPYSEMHETVPILILDIAESAQRIQKIVANLKDFARPGGSPVVSNIDLNQIVTQALRLLRHFVQQKTHHFHTRLTKHLPILSGDSQKLEQVVVNLVLNALEALPDQHSAVTVSTRMNDTGDHIELHIQDEGIGIPQEDLDKLFDAFFTTKQASGGTGLGLAISDTLVRELGGTIDFRSEPRKGTEVLVTFPC